MLKSNSNWKDITELRKKCLLDESLYEKLIENPKIAFSNDLKDINLALDISSDQPSNIWLSDVLENMDRKMRVEILNPILQKVQFSREHINRTYRTDNYYQDDYIILNAVLIVNVVALVNVAVQTNTVANANINATVNANAAVNVNVEIQATTQGTSGRNHTSLYPIRFNKSFIESELYSELDEFKLSNTRKSALLGVAMKQVDNIKENEIISVEYSYKGIKFDFSAMLNEGILTVLDGSIKH